MKAPLFLALGFGCMGLTQAADLFVTSGSSVQAAIVSASDGDRILIGPGTYVEQLDLLGKAIELIGTAGPASTIIDADLAGIAVRMTSGEGPGTVLRSLTVTRGSGGFGPGGVVTNGTPLLEDCVIRSNVGRLGAGVSGSPTMIRCRIENNVSSLNHGGGVYGAPTMIDCVVRGNRCTGAQGGGLYLTGGTASLSGCYPFMCAVLVAAMIGGMQSMLQSLTQHLSVSVTSPERLMISRTKTHQFCRLRSWKSSKAGVMDYAQRTTT